VQSARSSIVGKAMYKGLFEKITYVHYPRQDLPLGPSDMTFRGEILLDIVLLRHGTCIT
jgi:hypothetical protein